MFEILLLVVLLLLSGFFSGIEIAFMSLSHLRVTFLVNNDVKNSKVLAKLKSDPQRLLILILIGNNLVNISASALATSLAIDYFGSIGVGIATGVMTFLVLIFGEIAPKAYCTIHAEKVALNVSPFIKFLSRALYPVVEIFNYITKLTTNKVGMLSSQPLVTEDEVRNIVAVGEEEGSIKSSEKEMINNIFRFDDIEVGHIMTPRPNIFALEETLKVEDVQDDVLEEGFSRIPIYKGNIDNITGILYTRDLIRAKKNEKLSKILHPPMVIPETKKINKLFKEMNTKKNHLAIVVDEHGTVMGIVTIEDLIEEVFGEIYDETDDVISTIRKVNKNTYLVNSEAEIKDVYKEVGVKIPGKPHDFVSAYVLSKLGKIPLKGEVIHLKTCDIVAEKVRKNKIIELKIIINKSQMKYLKKSESHNEEDEDGKS